MDSDCGESPAESYATDPTIAEKLWRVSSELCKISANVHSELRAWASKMV